MRIDRIERHRSPRRPPSSRATRLALATLLALPTAGGAQRTWSSVGHDVTHTAGDVWNVWTSPFHADTRDWLDAALVTGAAAATTLADRPIDAWVAAHPSSAPVRALYPLREHGTPWLWDLTTLKRIVPIAGAFYVAGLAANSRDLRDAGLGILAVQEAMGIARTFLVYPLLRRTRPAFAGGNQYDFGVPGGPWQQQSFIAGHVANAIGIASFASTRYRLGLGAPVLYAVGATVGLARIANRQHWTSDVVLGTALGYATGRVVARRQLRRVDASRTPVAADVTPLRLGWRLTF